MENIIVAIITGDITLLGVLIANSKHLYGKALDFCIEGVSGTELLAYVQSDPRTNYAYIISGNYVHVDVK